MGRRVIRARGIRGKPGAGGVWGDIEGTLAEQADLVAALAGKVPTTRQVQAGGLATGGGALSGDVMISVTEASLAEAEAGTGNQPMTARRVKDQVDYRRGAANGLASLDANGLIPSNQLPPIAISDSYPVNSEAEMLALNAQRGDVAIRADENKTYILKTDNPATLGDWLLMKSPFALVSSVNGKTGVVNLVPSDVGAQPTDAELTALAGLSSAADQLPYFTGPGAAELTTLTALARTLLAAVNQPQMQTTLGLVPGVNVQAYDAELAALAGLVSAADRLPYFTGAGSAALATFTAAGRALVDDADAAAQRVTLGLGNVDNTPDTNKPISGPTQAALDNKVPLSGLFPGFRSGNWYGPPLATAPGTVAIGVDQLMAVPMLVWAPVTFTDIMISVTAAVAGNYYLGVYSNSYSGGNGPGYPNALLAQANVSTSSIAVVTAALSAAVAITAPTILWLVGLGNAAATVKAITNTDVGMLGFLLGAANTTTFFNGGNHGLIKNAYGYANGLPAAMPNTLGPQNAALPLIGVKAQ